MLSHSAGWLRCPALQEVAVLAEDGASARFLWRLGIGAQVGAFEA